MSGCGQLSSGGNCNLRLRLAPALPRAIAVLAGLINTRFARSLALPVPQCKANLQREIRCRSRMLCHHRLQQAKR